MGNRREESERILGREDPWEAIEGEVFERTKITKEWATPKFKPGELGISAVLIHQNGTVKYLTQVLVRVNPYDEGLKRYEDEWLTAEEIEGMEIDEREEV